MKKYTILWADDDPDDMMIMRDVLYETDHSFEVIEVSDGQKALDYLEKASEKNDLPCLIILDINMPIMGGRETLAAIKSKNELSEIPIVVFTTSSSELDKMFCRRYGVEMITKPPNFTTLKTVVQRLLSFCTIPK